MLKTEVQTSETESKKEFVQKSNKEMLNSINLIRESDSDLKFTGSGDSNFDDPDYDVTEGDFTQWDLHSSLY